MSALAQRRARILRVRAIEHRIAAARLAQADAAVANLDRIASRLAALRRSLTTTSGQTSGLALSAMAEMSQRLEAATVSLVTPTDDAERARARVSGERMKARQREESAGKLHERAFREENENREVRALAATPYRKRKPLMGYGQ